MFKVCANDAGGSEAFNMKWTSLLKLRLQCSTDVDKYQSHFNLVTDMVKGSGDLVYGTFTTLVRSCSRPGLALIFQCRFRIFQVGEPQSSAVCSFRLSDFQAAFNSKQLPSAVEDIMGPSVSYAKIFLQRRQYCCAEIDLLTEEYMWQCS